MFIDEVGIYVCGGRGGHGKVSLRGGKYFPAREGPAGGDGGRGGDVIMVADANLRTLLGLHRSKRYHGSAGGEGCSKGQHGSNGSHVRIPVPPGTLARDRNTEEIVADLKRPGDSRVVAKGGRGGRGNMRFITSECLLPRIAERGGSGDERWLNLELRLLADVGLVGFPNAGKSTLLGSISAARPKIANYPFTTLKPQLGVVPMEGGNSFVVADLPGLLEGAHKGKGLGYQFLRHMERTRLLLYVIDMSGVEGRDPYQDYQILQSEVRSYSEGLAALPHRIAANKMDVPGAEERLRIFRERVSSPVHAVSAFNKGNVRGLVYDLYDTISSLPVPSWLEEGEEGEEGEGVSPLSSDGS
ncbi:GTPase ObgE [Pasteuria penetrans]|uniref:GTPase ObgE n=1 Tax=Pasteuria penetrans TaxID=86005 RepID=UPI000FA94249|nr:GTPase ObgE [Pasteuria penetrans]